MSVDAETVDTIGHLDPESAGDAVDPKPSGDTPTWRLRALADPVSVLRRDPRDTVPAWVWKSGELVSVTRTAEELSIICSSETIGAEPGAVGPYVAYRVDDILDFTLTGVLSSLLEPLTEAGISILALSTHNTDWILVPGDRANEAVAEWRRRGHSVL